MQQKNKKHGPGKGSAYFPGQKSREAFITVNEKYGRIYFSAYAAKIFQLDTTGFDIFEQGGSWFFKVSQAQDAYKLIFHQYAFYCVDRKLVSDLIAAFPGERVLRLTIEDAERKAPKYLLTKRDTGLPKSAKEKKTGGGPHSPTPVPVKASPGSDDEIKDALKKIAFYERTDFRGRIKTLEVIRAEQIINAKR